jgi:hypothetical protein
LGSA